MPVEGKRVLAIGCGAGANLIEWPAQRQNGWWAAIPRGNWSIWRRTAALDRVLLQRQGLTKMEFVRE